MALIFQHCPFLKSSSRLVGVLLLGLTLLPAVAQASLRCDTHLVSRGSLPFEVLELCGDPVFETSRIHFLVPGVPVYVDEWLYETGRNKFRRLLRFENGRLVDIEIRRKPRRTVYRY